MADRAGLLHPLLKVVLFYKILLLFIYPKRPYIGCREGPIHPLRIREFILVITLIRRNVKVHVSLSSQLRLYFLHLLLLRVIIIYEVGVHLFDALHSLVLSMVWHERALLYFSQLSFFIVHHLGLLLHKRFSVKPRE